MQKNKKRKRPIGGRDDYLGRNELAEVNGHTKKQKRNNQDDDEQDLNERVEVKFNKSIQPKKAKFLRFSKKKTFKKTK